MQRCLAECANSLLDSPRHLCRVERDLATKQTLDPSGLASAEVTFWTLCSQHLAGSTNVESFLGTLMGLHLRHFK
jgi:hypothetical protein